MRFETIDIEATMLPNIHPWSPGSYLCSLCMEEGEIGKDDSFLQETSEVWFFNHVSYPIRDHKEMIKEIISRINATDLLVFHNAKFDLTWLIEMGIEFDHKPIWCTMIGDYLLYGQNRDVSKSLNACCERRGFGHKVDQMAEFWNNGIQTDEIPIDIHDKYVRQDVHLTKKLFLDQIKQIKRAKLEKIANITFEVSKILAHMEYNGAAFNREEAENYVKEYDAKLKILDEEIQATAGVRFSPGSSDQLNAVMFGGYLKREVQELVAKGRKDGTYRMYTRKSILSEKFPGLGFTPHESTLSKKTLKYSTGKKARLLMHCDTDQQKKFFKLLDERANAQKVYSTLIGKDSEEAGLLHKIGKDGRIHPNFNQCVTATGRLSSSNPNGQNLPRSGTSPLKKLITSSMGYIVNGDLSQIEWRMAAALSNDKTMIDELWNGFKVHDFVAQEYFGVKGLDPSDKAYKSARNHAKVFNFRMIYNGNGKSFYNDGTMPRHPLKFWEQMVDDFWKKYFGLRSWQKKNEKLVKSKGYLRNKSGRILTFHYNNDPDNGPIGYNFNAICNYPVQSGSTDLMFLAMVDIWKKYRKLGLVSKIIFQVHDAIVWDCPEKEVYIISKICSETFDNLPKLALDYYNWEINVPLTGEISIGKTYGDLDVEFKSHEITEENIQQYLDSNK